MFFEMRMDSEYELLVTEEEITTPRDIKPLLVLDTALQSILDADYNPVCTFIKEEPTE